MPRWTIRRTSDGELLRHGHVAVANGLGTVTADETAVEDTKIFDGKRRYQWDGDSFEDAGIRDRNLGPMYHMSENPRTGWPITVPADLAPDTNDDELLVRRCDDTVEEGMGWEGMVPLGANYVRLVRESRPETAPGGAKTTKWNLRGVTVDESGAGTWSAALQVADVAITTTEDWIPTTELIPLASVNLTEGEMGILLLSRDATDVGDDLSGDADLLDPQIEFR